jgi:hypothetical protein
MQRSSKSLHVDHTFTSLRLTGGREADSLRYSNNPPDLWVNGGALFEKDTIVKTNLIVNSRVYGNIFSNEIAVDKLVEAYSGQGIDVTSDVTFSPTVDLTVNNIQSATGADLELSTSGPNDRVVIDSDGLDMQCHTIYDVGNIVNTNCPELTISSANLTINSTNFSAGGNISFPGNLFVCDLYVNNIYGPSWQSIPSGPGGTVTTVTAGSGLNVGAGPGGSISVAGTLNIANGGVTDTMLAGSISNAKLQNASLSVTAGAGLTGGGAVSLGGSTSLSLSATPTVTSLTVTGPISNATDAATKQYVDAAVASLNVHDSVYVATTSAAELNTPGVPAYNNGMSGVGATLTAASLNVALTIDGHTFTGTDVTNVTRVLVKNQVSQPTNGIYVFSQLQTAILPWVLTRAADADNSPSGEFIQGDFNFVQAGTVNASTGWVETCPGTGPGGQISIGTDNICYTQISGAGTYSAGSGLNLTGTVFSVATSGVTNAMLANSSLTVTAGTGLTGGGAVSLGGSTTLNIGTVPVVNGGTNVTSYAVGDLLYASGASTLSKLAIGSATQVLTVNGGLPSWQNAVAASPTRYVDTTVGQSFNSTLAGPPDSRQLITLTQDIYLTQIEVGHLTVTGAITIRDNVGGIGVLGTAIVNETDPGVVVIASISSTGGIGSSPASSNVRRVTYPNVYLAAGTYQVSFAFTGDSRIVNPGGGTTSPSGYNFWIVLFGTPASSVTSVTGTANQVNVSASTGAVTFSLPQDIASSSSPTFTNEILSNQLRFTNGIVIGDSSTATSVASGLAIGKAASANATNAIAIGEGTLSLVPNAVAIGAGITANQPSGFFVQHRGPLASTVNAAGFIAGTNELIEVTSSRRFKQNIRDLESVIDKIDTLRPVRYNAKPGHGDDREHIGLIAEEVEELFPEFVTYDAEGNVTGMMYDRMVSLLIKAFQSLKGDNKNLESRLTQMEDKLEKLLL